MNSSARIRVFDRKNFKPLCDHLARKNEKIEKLIERYGYPVLKKRARGFEGLARLILEQQVSLSSAMATLEKLSTMAGGICPEHMISLKEKDFRACGVSRQKTRYILLLSQMIVDGDLDMASIDQQADGKVRERLLSITGIGPWTCDCYLLLCLQRVDIFPMGDLALLKSMKESHLVGLDATRIEIQTVVDRFRPHRSILAKVLWHAYLERRGFHPH